MLVRGAANFFVEATFLELIQLFKITLDMKRKPSVSCQRQMLLMTENKLRFKPFVKFTVPAKEEAMGIVTTSLLCYLI